MTQQLWTDVDRYICEQFVGNDEVLEAALAASDAADLPPVQVSPNEGKLLQMLAELCGARQILEIGTLGGYSTIWMARALPPGGRLITLEADPKHAEVARANIDIAGFADRVEVRVGLAINSLQQLAEEQQTFDLVFLDADKENNPAYLEWSLKLSQPGTLIIADNVVRRGAVIDAGSDDATIQGLRRFHEMLATDPRVTATAIQTVGVKGHDGFAVVRVVRAE